MNTIFVLVDLVDHSPIEKDSTSFWDIAASKEMTELRVISRSICPVPVIIVRDDFRRFYTVAQVHWVHVQFVFALHNFFLIGIEV